MEPKMHNSHQTQSPSAIRNFVEEDNPISHTMSTVLIGPDGKLVRMWTVTDWTVGEAMSAIQQVENASH